jgi:hypothetical protein
MEVSMADRRTIIKRSFRRYQKADRATKTLILDEVLQQTGYRNRASVALILRQWNTEHWTIGPRGPLRLLGGLSAPAARRKTPLYGEAVRGPLIRLWHLCEFFFTCTVTELCVGWTELRPLPTKARLWVCKALENIRTCAPFSLIALGTDTGSEFVNNNLFDW